MTNLLAHVPPDMPVVVATHIPLKADREAPHRSTANRAELVALLCGRPHVLTLSGHLHMAERHLLGAEDGCAEAPVPHWVLGTVSGVHGCTAASSDSDAAQDGCSSSSAK